METAEQLFEAAQAERHALIAKHAFAYGKTTTRESNILQGILRRAWEPDAKAADARLGRAALVGAEDVKTGSRGFTRRTDTPTVLPVHVKAAQERDAAAMKHFKKSRMTLNDLADAMGTTPQAAKTAIARLLRDGKIKKVGKWSVFSVYGVAK